MTIKSIGLSGVALVVLVAASPALAGGFQRSIADTDILFEKGTFATRLGATYVKPERGFESINGRADNDSRYTGAYGLPSAAIYYGSDDFGCAGSYVESFAADADYSGVAAGSLPRQASGSFLGSPIGTSNAARLATNSPLTSSTSRTVGISFDSEEFSATCRASYSTETMRFSLIGGIYAEDFHFEGESLGEANVTPLLSAGQRAIAFTGAQANSRVVFPSRVEVDSDGDYKFGYRLGAAFEMPDIALRLQALYRSEIKHDDVEGTGSVAFTGSVYVVQPDGTTRSIPVPALATGINNTLAANGRVIGQSVAVASFLNEATSPQYLQISGQTGIAAGTLLLGSFRWTDWSTNGSVISTISSPLTGTSSSYSPYNWRDGYTASIGIGKAFNEQVSGALSFGYDRGVSTGSETTYTDLYTISAGVSYKPAPWSEIRLGGLVGFWSDGEQKVSDGAYFDGTVGDDNVYGATASVKFTF